MTTLLKSSLNDLTEMEIRAAQAKVVDWQGREALLLENGLALFPDFQCKDARIEVRIGTDGAAYPGVAFRAIDVLNYELAYAVPHVSGQWDALQYDPVFRGSNTWQLYYGPSYQRAVEVPTGRWFRLQVEIRGRQATFSVDGQPPLIVEQLAHPAEAGMLGLWTFLPAHFCDLHVSTCTEQDTPAGVLPDAIEGIVAAWLVEGYGVVKSEPNGVVNLNRHLPASLGEARLTRRFVAAEETEVALDLGFSDVLDLELDGEEIFSGECTFQGFADRPARGYAELGRYSLQQVLAPGVHQLTAVLRVSEGFGWGLAVAARGEGLQWLPAELG